MKIGFIGIGNMAKAIITGIVKSDFMDSKDIYISSKTKENAKAFADANHITYLENNKEVVKTADYIVLCVHPETIEPVLKEIKEDINNHIIISIAAGKSIKQMEDVVGDTHKIVRIMPNANAIISQSMNAIWCNKNVNEAEQQTVIDIFNTIGKTQITEEKDFATFSVIAGCMPAYVYEFINTAADSALANGIKKEEAVQIIAQAVLGSAQMVLTQDENCSALIERVCSPGGTTIAGLVNMRDHGFNKSINHGIQAAINKDKDL